MPETKVSIPTSGTHGKITVNENVFTNGPHNVNLDATVLVPKNLEGPVGVGMGSTYTHDAGHMARVQVDHMPTAGTTVAASAQARLWTSDDKSAHMDLTGSAARHFPTYGCPSNSHGAMLSFTKKF